MDICLYGLGLRSRAKDGGPRNTHTVWEMILSTHLEIYRGILILNLLKLGNNMHIQGHSNHEAVNLEPHDTSQKRALINSFFILYHL